ncbi:DUF4870 family protein [Sneathiella sp.]|uniref:DUF4870 family protein n=1 Tax=Sneathiella sp. TaxID=1964365 RepID=UPI0025F77BAA|nr:hypothetical protein [Sneathiella sp.]
MRDVIKPVAPPPAEGPARMAQIIYFLYLAGLVFPIAHLVGVIMAYVNRGDGPEWVESHLTFQIRTFWMFLLYGIIGTLLTPIGVGFLIIFLVYIWLIVRCAKGLKSLTREAAVADPATWLW